jgi:hypothetical protein
MALPEKLRLSNTTSLYKIEPSDEPEVFFCCALFSITVIKFPLLIKYLSFIDKITILHKTNSMRKRRSLSILALILAIAFTGYVIFSFWVAETATGEALFEVHSGESIIGMPDTAFGGIFEMVQLNDSLPYRVYKPLADSIKNILDERERQNNGDLMGGMSLGFFGVYNIETPIHEVQRQQIESQYSLSVQSAQAEARRKQEMTNNADTVKMLKQQLQDSTALYYKKYNDRLADLKKRDGQLHYLGLIGYYLPEKTRFFIQNGTYNLAYVKWDSISKEGQLKYGHYERKQIPVRYTAKENRINIPLSYNQYVVLNTLAIIVAFGLLFLIVYLFVGLPLQILINISKGKAFDERNIHRFTIMYRIMLTTIVLYLVIPYLLWLGFHKMIPDDFYRPGFRQSLWDCKWLILVTIVLFLIRKAFQKGNSLQREQDLTI